MEKVFNIKNEMFAFIGVFGAVISSAFGGWNDGMTALCVAMCIDYITGILVASVFHNSNKSEDGRLSSFEGWKGLVKKCVTLMLIMLAVHIDVVLNLDNFIRDALIIGFFANECVSIIENCGLMGMPLPKILVDAIDVLKKKADAHLPTKNDEESDGDDDA